MFEISVIALLALGLECFRSPLKKVSGCVVFVGYKFPVTSFVTLRLNGAEGSELG